MKTVVLFIAMCVVVRVYSQNIGINDNGTAPNSNAILDVDVSTNDKGVLIPRLTTAQRTSIAGLGATEEGLTVYDETTKSFWYWDGSQWIEIATSLSAGSGGWGLLGNAGTTSGTNFLGTTDAQALDIRTNNVIRTRITTKGQIEVFNTGQSVFLGEAAGQNDNLATNRNVYVGYYAGYSNTGGALNTAIGHEPMRNSTGGNYNTAIGRQALYNNSTGDWNTAIGDQALLSNTGGHANVAVGKLSLYSNTSGNYNVAIGVRPLYQNTSGEYNIALGYDALRSNNTGGSNVALGHNALYMNVNANYNIALGPNSLYSNNSGENNIALGRYALYSNVNGYSNIALGKDAQYQNNGGYYNIAIGTAALYANISGINNVAIGHNTLTNNTASYNTAVGKQALYKNSTGTRNTAVGFNALYENATGNNNTALGYGAFQTSANSGYTNSTAIGYNAPMNASNKVVVGNSSVTTIGGYANWTNLSDGRFKINVQENVHGLDFILKLRPVTYQLDINKLAEHLHTPDSLRLFDSEKLKAKEIQCGFIAQEVEKAAQEVNFNFHGIDKPKNPNDHYGLRYAEFVVPIVKAIQEQQEIITNQQTNLAKQQKEIELLKEKVEKLEKLLQKQ
ncbi:MAG: hypothetical protein D6707_05995 [Bacteroidetes bacterium]|nr:MAG: hypothetical protein D6707_05995 [Bacteroidota bacterium]